MEAAKKKSKTFLIEVFFPFATGVNDTVGCTLSCEYLHDFQKKFETALLGGRGLLTLISLTTKSDLHFSRTKLQAWPMIMGHINDCKLLKL